MALAEDGVATLEWIDRYLERVRSLPVLAQVDPGEIRARLPEHPPEEGEPFADLLRDMDDLLLPGLTHWQSPRFFAYFATCASEPAILAQLLAAGLNNVGILWRTSPALQELEEVTLAWLAQLLGLPTRWHGQLEDGASISTLAALAAARHARPGHPSSCVPSTPIPPSRRPVASSVSRSARLPSTTPFAFASSRSNSGMRVRQSPPWVRRRRRRSIPSGHSPMPVHERASGSTSTPRTPARRWCARSSVGHSTGSTASTPSL